MPVVRAALRVMTSSPVPPVMVSMLATVAVLAKLPRVRLSLPAPRSMLALEAPAPRVMVSLPVPPVSGLDVADGERCWRRWPGSGYRRRRRDRRCRW